MGVDKLLKIGEVAAESGLSVKTIRYYDDIGLLSPTVDRSRSGYRLFAPGVLTRLAFIKRAQGLGLSLAEIAEILKIRDRGDIPCDQVKQHLQAKVADINEQIIALEGLKGELQELLSQWEDQPSASRMAGTICPNIELKA
ncbi:MAG: heavy metal-responsive transcriptional regulator [Arthrospira sp. PLM2.Bin9]|nr:heavy metal-responsive transcriptional regulator [Arthrospira sp. PLM2.Bin9]TVU54628.1 MAG: heavy metal-responsive transcriptional regulator [Arthrospira sp. PLM2.Bin9]